MGNALSVLIVDDEPLGLARVRDIVSRDPEVNIIGACGSVAEALHASDTVAPELVFLDVRMPQHDGFELLRSLHGRGVHPLIVFVTAYSEHAVTAFDEEAIDYVLKPFDDARLTRALARAKAEIFKVRAGGPRGGDSRPPPRVRDRLMVTDNGRTLLLPIRDIEFLQAAGKRVKIFAQGSCYLLRRPLRELEASLDPNQFVRVHRSTLVNVEQILEMHALFHGDFEIVLKRGTRIPMSRRFRDRMLPFTLGRWPS